MLAMAAGQQRDPMAFPVQGETNDWLSIHLKPHQRDVVPDQGEAQSDQDQQPDPSSL